MFFVLFVASPKDSSSANEDLEGLCNNSITILGVPVRNTCGLCSLKSHLTESERGCGVVNVFGCAVAQYHWLFTVHG